MENLSCSISDTLVTLISKFSGRKRMGKLLVRCDCGIKLEYRVWAVVEIGPWSLRHSDGCYLWGLNSCQRCPGCL